jgi:hypothetical protein
MIYSLKVINISQKKDKNETSKKITLPEWSREFCAKHVGVQEKWNLP